MEMTTKELASLVREMRNAQSDYFASKRHGGDPSVSKRMLGQSKLLEAKVDRIIEEICSGEIQRSLF